MNDYWVRDSHYIKTTEGEPRLLLVAVDVQDCTTAVTFDSYPKKMASAFQNMAAAKQNMS
jgi:hypothetical protein